MRFLPPESKILLLSVIKYLKTLWNWPMDVSAVL